MKRKYITVEQQRQANLSPEANGALDGIHMCLAWASCDVHTDNLKLVLKVMREDGIGPLLAVKKLLDAGEIERDGVPWSYYCPLEDDE